MSTTNTIVDWVFDFHEYESILRLISKYFSIFILCYIITVDMDFWFVPGDPVCFDKLSLLWLVNREVAVCRGRLVEQVCNRKETTWYENHAVRFRQSVQSESKIKPRICCQSEALGCPWWYGLRGGGVGTPRFKKEDMGQEEVPSLSICLSISLKLTTNCVPLSRMKWEIYIFYKEVCFSSFDEVRSLSLCSRLGLWVVCNNWRFWDECQAVQYAVLKFLEEWIALWCFFPHRLCLTDLFIVQ